MCFYLFISEAAVVFLNIDNIKKSGKIKQIQIPFERKITIDKHWHASFKKVSVAIIKQKLLIFKNFEAIWSS